eukprot:5362426-Prymnesium_polylepis.2
MAVVGRVGRGLRGLTTRARVFSPSLSEERVARRATKRGDQLGCVIRQSRWVTCRPMFSIRREAMFL